MSLKPKRRKVTKTTKVKKPTDKSVQGMDYTTGKGNHIKTEKRALYTLQDKVGVEKADMIMEHLIKEGYDLVSSVYHKKPLQDYFGSLIIHQYSDASFYFPSRHDMRVDVFENLANDLQFHGKNALTSTTIKKISKYLSSREKEALEKEAEAKEVGEKPGEEKSGEEKPETETTNQEEKK